MNGGATIIQKSKTGEFHERYSPAMCGSGPIVQEPVRELFMP
jgi:hypothetical protein